MRISRIRISNLRSCKHAEIPLDAYTCLVGPNGAGKSTILVALNIFFGDYRSSTGQGLSLEDFHHKDASNPIEVELTFTDLSEAAKDDFQAYCRQDQLIVSAVASYDPTTGQVDVRQFGKRLGMVQFARFFEAVSSGEKVEKLKQIYAELKNDQSELPEAKTKDAMANALLEFETKHPTLCELIPSEDQFYGFTKGTNKLEKYLQWVYVPAVKDAATEQAEVRNTAFSKLLMRTVRAQINFKETVEALRKQTRESYQRMLSDNQSALEGISESLKSKLTKWCHPDASLVIRWHEEPDKSVKIDEPIAKIIAGEGAFAGELTRFGHGFQRSYILALLEVLATLDDSQSPTLVLGCEEPELYQHPPQARHLADVLNDLSAGNAQVLISTHSPWFVSGHRFEQIRMVRKDPIGSACVSYATVDDYREKHAAARGESQPNLVGTLMKINQALQPHINEIFFAPCLVLVEGLEDVAYITAYLHLMEMWQEYRQAGCHIVATNNKSNILMPLIITQLLDIPAFVVCDADSDANKDNGNYQKHQKDNLALLKQLGYASEQPMPASILWKRGLTMWPHNLGDSVQSEITDWTKYKSAVERRAGFVGDLQKNSLFIAECLTDAWNKGHKSASLQKLCKEIIKFAREHQQRTVPTETLSVPPL